MSGDMTASKNSSIEGNGPKGFDCLNCRSQGVIGMDHCRGCGMRYVWQEVPDSEEEEGTLGGGITDDSEPLFDQKAVECGYLDVELGVFAFTGPTCSNRYELSECQNCGTLLEIPLKSCPLCRGALKKMSGGLAKLAFGVIASGATDPSDQRAGFCKSCGDMVANEDGRCHNCNEKLVPQNEEFSNPIIRIIPTENIVFAHLDVESGTMECLSQDGRSETVELSDDRLHGESTANDIDTFGRIQLMFDEQASMILSLTSDAPMIASDICRRMGIPRSVCYRKLKMMTNAKLLVLCRTGGSPCDWQVTRYQSNIEMAYVSLEHGEMDMLIRLKDGKETLTQKFSADMI